MKDDESLKEEVEVKKMKEGSPTMQDDSFSIKADEDSSSYDATIKTEQGKLEQVKKEEVEMDMGAPSSSSSSSVPVPGDEWEEVPLTYDEELEVVFREEGLIDETLENPFRIIARYISLEDELKLTDDDCGARVDLGEKALQDLIEEVETINEQTIRELGKLSSDQKQPGTFMLLKIKGLAADLQRRLDKDEDDDYIAQCCSSKNKADGVTTLLEAVRTKWITHLYAIARYVELKRAVIRLTTGANYATLGLEKFVLKPAEWSLAEELIPVYHAFKDCFVSLAKGDAPLVHQTIPIIRTLRERLAAIVNNDAASQIIRHGASNVIKVLENFYPETGGSDMYTIAMSMSGEDALDYSSDMPQQFFIPDLSLSGSGPKVAIRSGLIKLSGPSGAFGRNTTCPMWLLQRAIRTRWTLKHTNNLLPG
ncbi:hypothetical protein SISNIDRAFT_167312 [Sistotremastrum niveocremeum HHB9708]|uniref:Uncharacterized protein n=1 Tax=Sistotremastrum niveocremeum HHB9708 TaxID=1314777 RepID=A0A164S9V8_9AGAM|nr:hypothetical protein SISNIDRAFT_167312 [Sistotremastrum niveocremeum HHB9708]